MGCTTTQERYTPRVIGVDTSLDFNEQSVGAFLPVTSGTITITDNLGTALLTAYPVTAGVFARIAMYIGQNGGTFTTAGGASGTILL